MNGYPGPFKCPECGIYWAGFEHRCQPSVTTGTTTFPGADGWLVRCTCPPGRFTTPNELYVGTCPIHDVQTTQT